MLFDLNNYDYCWFGFDFPVRTIPLYTMLAGCGFACETDKSYRWHGLKRGGQVFGLWQYTVCGRGEIEYEGKVYSVEPGSAFMVDIPHDHCYYLPADSEKWEFIYMNFNGREALRIWNEIETRFGPVAHFGSESKTVKVATEILSRAIADDIESPLQCSSLTYQFLMQVIEDLATTVDFRGSPPEFVQIVSNYCLTHLHEPITVDDMSNVAGYSRYHFTRLFTKYHGMSPGVFLKDLRIRRAIRLLQTEHISVKEVAERCGFDSANYFCKVFRKAIGTSPNAYRYGK